MPNTWTEQQLDRFMVAEITIDELRTVADEFPGLFTADQIEAIMALQCNAWEGLVEEPLVNRGARMRRIRDKLEEAFPCDFRTEEERDLQLTGDLI